MAPNQMAPVSGKAPSSEKSIGKIRRPKKSGKAATKLSPVKLWTGFSPVRPLA